MKLSHDLSNHICCSHHRVGHQLVLSQGRGNAKKLIDVTSLFSSGGV